MCNDAYHFSGATRWMQSVLQTHVRTTESLSNWVLLLAVCCLPCHLSVFVCRVLVLWSFQVGCLNPLVWLFCPLFSFLLSSLLFSFAFGQSSQDFRWSDAVTKSPSMLAQHAKPSICFLGSLLTFSSLFPFLPLHLLLYPHPQILENRKCILLSDGWAPCSCWEERKKKNFLSLQGSQMSFAVSKLRVGSVFWERLGTLGAWAPGSHGHSPIMCEEGINCW